MRRLGRTAGKVLLAVGAVVTALVVMGAVGEVVIRHRERTRDTPPGDMPLIFYPHRRLGYALVRDFDYFGWAYVNRDGFRGRALPEDASDRLRVMVVGASTTFDAHVSGDDATWPARLEHWLGELAPACEVAVINAGVPGYRMIDNVIRFETELYRYEPDVILLYAAHNNLVHALFSSVAPDRPTFDPRPDEIEYHWPVTGWLVRHSLFWGKLAGRWKAISVRGLRRGSTRVPPSDSVWNAGIARGAATFDRDVRAFLAVARNLGIQVIVPQVTHVSGAGAVAEPDAETRRMWAGTYHGLAPETVLRGYAAFDSVARAAAAEFGAIHLPTAAFAPRGIALYSEGDAIHFNDAGADRMGRGVAESLLRGGHLPREACRLPAEGAS